MRFGAPTSTVVAIAALALTACPGGSSRSKDPLVQSVSPSSGDTNGGLPITIMGAHFQAGAMVSIGGAPASSVVVAPPVGVSSRS